MKCLLLSSDIKSMHIF